MSNDVTPGKPQAWLLRDYDEAITTLAALREEKGVTVMQIAAHTGASRRQIYHWLKGSCEPGARRLIAYANALGYDIALIPRQVEEAP
jgi:transcriptional regulator with XRE-family HTH domain